MRVKHKIGDIRRCLYFNDCGVEEVYNGKWMDWYKHKDGLICHKCYMKLIINPRRTPEYIKKYTDRRPKGWCKKYNKLRKLTRRIRFKTKRIHMKTDFRTHQCQLCRNKIGDEYINSKGKKAYTKKIDIHHIQYHEDEPLKDTIEICRSCHSKITWKKLELIF
jgi:hypothetical protein